MTLNDYFDALDDALGPLTDLFEGHGPDDDDARYDDTMTNMDADEMDYDEFDTYPPEYPPCYCGDAPDTIHDCDY